MITSRVCATTAVVVLALGLAACGSGSQDSGTTVTPSPSSGSASSTASTVVDGERTYAGLTQDHVDGPVSYPQSPPVGGPHNPVWMPCDGRVYDAAVPNERAVHSLEHGAVWIAWRPDLASADVEKLHAEIEGINYRFGSPYPGLTSAVTVTAWGHQMDATSVDDPRIATFLAAYTAGPQTPEPGATCADPSGASPDVHSG